MQTLLQVCPYQHLSGQVVVQASWDSSSDEDAEGPAIKALRSLEQQVASAIC